MPANVCCGLFYVCTDSQDISGNQTHTHTYAPVTPATSRTLSFRRARYSLRFILTHHVALACAHAGSVSLKQTRTHSRTPNLPFTASSRTFCGAFDGTNALQRTHACLCGCRLLLTHATLIGSTRLTSKISRNTTRKKQTANRVVEHQVSPGMSRFWHMRVCAIDAD